MVARHPQAHNLSTGLKDLPHSLIIQVCGQTPDKGLPSVFWASWGGSLLGCSLGWTLLNFLEGCWLSYRCPSDA